MCSEAVILSQVTVTDVLKLKFQVLLMHWLDLGVSLRIKLITLSFDSFTHRQCVFQAVKEEWNVLSSINNKRLNALTFESNYESQTKLYHRPNLNTWICENVDIIFILSRTDIPEYEIIQTKLYSVKLRVEEEGGEMWSDFKRVSAVDRSYWNHFIFKWESFPFKL